MVQLIIKHFFRFFILLLFQVLIVDKFPFGSYFTPYPYILFLLLLPIEVKPFPAMVIGMLSGYALDLFSDTFGLHAATGIFLAVIRYYYLKISLPKEMQDSTHEPSIIEFGFSWFAVYTATLTIAHHFFLFYLEIFSFSSFFDTFFRVLLSSALTLFIIFILIFLFFPIRNKQ